MSERSLSHAYETVNLWRQGGAAIIELNRPETMNAWNRQFGLDLLAAVEAVRDDEEVRAVGVTGAGRGFSSGADLKGMGEGHDLTPEGRPDVYSVLTQRYHPIITGIRTMPKPVVSIVNGPCVGIGLSLAKTLFDKTLKAKFDFDKTFNGSLIVTDSTDPNVKVRFIIERMCNDFGTADEKKCILSENFERGGSQPLDKLGSAALPMYRITVRSDGVRNSQTYAQAIVTTRVQ